MRAFVTGATGFAGSHLVDSLVAEGVEVTALIHPPSGHQQPRDDESYRAVMGNLLDREGVITAVSDAQPDVIYHLAGLASIGRSWQNPAQWLAVNAGGTANVLDAALAAGKPRVVIITSAEIYGVVKSNALPITEARRPAPDHPYGISKVAAGQLAPLYWRYHQLPVVEARPFNHIGPRQAQGFVVADFASQLAAIKLGRQPAAMQVGNLAAQRDFTDVRDVVRAYRALAADGRPGETYLICSGHAVSINTILNALIELAGVPVEVAYDPARMRPSDTPCIYGSYAKIKAHTGWEPSIHLRQSLADALAYWERRLLADEGA